MTGRDDRNSLILVGAGGRVGLRLRRAWARAGLAPPFAVSHRPGPGIDATPDDAVAEAMPGALALVLSGAVPREGAARDADTRRARAGIAVARRLGATRILVASSSAVYGPTGDAPATESTPPAPVNAYGATKLATERAVRAADVTCLRLTNVAGASQPFDTIAAPAGRRPRLDRFTDGAGPSRSYVGPVTLAKIVRALAQLHAGGHPLPDLLNVAAPRPTAMADIFAAAGAAFDWTPAPDGAVQRVHLGTDRLAALMPLDPGAGAADRLWAEIRATGDDR